MKKVLHKTNLLKEAGVILIAAIMLLSTMVVAKTEQPTQPLSLDDWEMSIEDVTAHPGEKGVVIPVNGVWAEDIQAYVFRIAYDPEMIEFSEVNLEGCVGEGHDFDEFYPPGIIHFQVYLDPPVAAGSGKLAKIVVNITGDEGTTDLTFVDGFNTYRDTNGVSHEPTVINGTITIVPETIVIESIAGGVLFVKAGISNIGDSDLTAVPWSITLDGGFMFLGEETNGTVDIPSGETVTVRSSLIFGVGKTNIIVTADIAEETAEAMVIAIFILLQ